MKLPLAVGLGSTAAALGAAGVAITHTALTNAGIPAIILIVALVLVVRMDSAPGK